jgi:hypothetical protein
MKPKIPKGWHKLRKGTVTRIYDNGWSVSRGWFDTWYPGHRVGHSVCLDCEPYIRRNAKKKGTK